MNTSPYGNKDFEGPYKKGQIVWRTRADGTRRDARVIESHSKSTVVADGGRFTLLNEQLSETREI